MYRKLLPLVTSIGLLVWSAGCSDSPSDTADQSQDPNLSEAFGGYLATDEAPAFGDSELAAEVGEMVAVDDPMLSDPDVSDAVSDTSSEYYHFRAVWGRLQYDSTVTEVTDWTGLVTISRGAAIIRHTVRFELGQDYIPTRTDRALVEWVSYTTVHHDGVDIDFFVPYDSEAVDPVTVTFETGPYSRTFDLEDLVALDTVVQLDDSNAVAFYGFRLDRYPCPRGFLAGHWGYDDEGNGVFRGVWLSRIGYVTGYLNGHFGVNDDGLKVFYGKWITRNGQFEGLLRGTYGLTPGQGNAWGVLRNGAGWFEGGIFDADGSEIGVMKGRYKSHPWWRHGFFEGRWKLYCSEEPTIANSEEGF